VVDETPLFDYLKYARICSQILAEKIQTNIYKLVRTSSLFDPRQQI
jgi:hypothetical protein